MKLPKFSPDPNFAGENSLSTFFIRHDGLRTLENNLVFSLFNTYQCGAGCAGCYLRDRWTHEYSANDFAPALEVFTYFDHVTTIDDLFLLKTRFPHLYEIYEYSSNKFWSNSMTDIGFVQQNKLVMDLNFAGVSDVSFSEDFLSNNNWSGLRYVEQKLYALHEKYNIKNLKLILSTPHPQPKTVQFLKTLSVKGIRVLLHDDIWVGTNRRHGRLAMSTRFDYNGYPYLINTEALILQGTRFFMTLMQATAGTPHFYDLNHGFNPHTFAYAMLEGKRNTYMSYAKDLESVDNKFRDYFEFVSSSLVTDPDYNFIPKMELNPLSVFYRKLSESMDEVGVGLLVHGATKVRPVFSISRSKEKLSYFNIRCTR